MQKDRDEADGRRTADEERARERQEDPVAGDLAQQFDMTKPTMSHHFTVLKEAGLVATRKSGREKLHFLNAVPIAQIYDRWIDKYAARHVSALLDLKRDLESD